MSARRGILTALLLLALAPAAWAGPETALREFASAQIKKGVRVLGMGGDGATWGNYGLVWREAGGTVFDYGITHFADTGNDIHFVGGGFTTPSLWRKLAVYVVVVDQWANGVRFHAKSAAFAQGADFVGEGSDQAVFAKLAFPLGHGLSLGFIAGWERSAMAAHAVDGSGDVNWTTTYLPSVGGGLAWEPNRWLLGGIRVLTNNDLEDRRDAAGVTSGYLGSVEVRAGLSVKLWPGGLVDAGYVGLWRRNDVDKTNTFTHALAAGIEQWVWPRHVALRAGWDESSPTAGLTLRAWRFRLDGTYVYNLGNDRTKEIFGHEGHTVIFALIYDYLPKHGE